MNPVDAVRLMARHYPGGVDALAVLLGKSSETLRKEIAGNDPRYKLGVNDACHISEACIAIDSLHCRAYANAVAANCGGYVALEVREQAPASLHGELAGVVKEASDVLTAGTAALSDSVLSDNDRKAVDRELTELLERVQSLQAAVRAKHESDSRRVRAVA